MFKTDAVIGILDRLLLIIIAGSILFIPNSLGKFTIEWFIWIQTICYGITAIASFVFLYKRLERPRFNYQHGFTMVIRNNFV